MLVQRIEQEPDLDPPDLVIYFATHGDPEHAARLLRPLMSVCPRGLDLYDLGVLRDHALARGLVLVEDGHGELIVDVATSCIYCRQEHAADDDHVCEGATPTEEIDADDTAGMCQIGFHALNGPPDFCCAGRRRLYEALHGSKPIRQCRSCNGLGLRVMGVPCEACEGSGVQP